MLHPVCIADAYVPERVEWMNKEAKESKWEAIGGWISDTAKQYIRSIPVCANGEKDGYVWPMEKDGKYSAKSGYHVLKPV